MTRGQLGTPNNGVPNTYTDLELQEVHTEGAGREVGGGGEVGGGEGEKEKGSRAHSPHADDRCIYTHTHTYIYLFVWVCVCIYIGVYIYKYIYI